MQAKTDARDVLRQLVSALNGLAGIHILEDKVGVARLSCDKSYAMLLVGVICRCVTQWHVTVRPCLCGRSTGNKMWTVISYSVSMPWRTWQVFSVRILTWGKMAASIPTS